MKIEILLLWLFITVCLFLTVIFVLTIGFAITLISKWFILSIIPFGIIIAGITILIKYLISKTLFCEHDYELINQIELKSEYDIVVESGFTPKTTLNITRKVITDYKCTKCNKMKRLTAKI